MQTTITGRHFEVTEPIKEYIMEKTARFEKYLHNITSAHIILSVENIRQNAEIILNATDIQFLAKEETPDMYASIDKAVDKIEHQLRHHKDKVKDHKHHQKEQYFEHQAAEEATEEKDAPLIVTEKKTLKKPMSPEEAALELDVQQMDFLVFRDMSDEKIKVIYRKKDGSYGLIETQ